MSRTASAVVILGLLAGAPASAAAGGLDVRVGGFFPTADSNLFDDDAELYRISTNDNALTDDRWRGFAGGIELNLGLGRNVELGFHVDGYGRSLQTEYVDFERPNGREIQQTLKLTVVPAGVSFRLVGSRRWPVVPYAGVGADLVFWKYEENGDFVDFDSANLTIIPDSFISEGVAPGFHVMGGIRVPLGRDFSVVAEGRYLFAKRDMGDDFRGNRIDLGGLSATVGLNLRF